MKTLTNFKSLGRVLSKTEMKEIWAGYLRAATSCRCIGSTGAWTYSGNPPLQVLVADINEYCASGQGTCS